MLRLAGLTAMNIGPSNGLTYVKSPPRGSPIVVVLGPSITRAEIPRLCERAHTRLRTSDAGVVICDAHALTDPDAVAIDALARLQLTAKRVGRELWLRHACSELQELISLAGLSEVLRVVKS